MGKSKIAAVLILVLAGCSAQDLAKWTVVIEAARQALKPPAEATHLPTPTPTPTLPPTATPEPTKPPAEHIPDVGKNVPCGKLPASDGFKRGFTWKPSSDTQKWAVAVLPPETSGPCTIAGLKARGKGVIGGDGVPAREVHILDGWTGERLEKIHGPIIVRCGCWSWSVKRPSQRVD